MTARRFFAPEVVQASAMDCGPASLKCLLEGHGTSVSYGRLREACQTDVDGASIDTLEEVAGHLGLDAHQVMLPLDHVLLPEAAAVPALVVTRLPAGDTHFVVLWRVHGPFVQLMDPATGRRWTTSSRFLNDCYVHTTVVPAAAWREWAASPETVAIAKRRLGDLGIGRAAVDGLLTDASADSGWRRLAALDAATRMTASLVSARGVRRGAEAERVLRHLIAHADAAVPDAYWAVRSTPSPEGEEHLRMRGAVLVAIRGTQPAAKELSPELAAALEERRRGPGRELLKVLAGDGVLAPAAMMLAVVLAAGGVLIEALLFRGFFDLGRELGLSGQRLGAIGLAAALLALLVVLEFPLVTMALQMGRHLECRLRLAFLKKIPRLGDRYFQSRLKSDMTERSHNTYRVRRLPTLGVQLLRAVFELAFTTVGIVWLDPAAAPLAVASAGVALLLPLAAQPFLSERDLRVRTHAGALGRYTLDALLGLRPIRCHGAERAIRREHEGLLVEWAQAAFRMQRLAVGVEALQLLLGTSLSAWLLIDHLGRSGEVGGVLLLVYWALNLPAIGAEIAQVAWQYPSLRNTTLRLLEPLGAIEHEPAPGASEGLMSGARTGVGIAMDAVSVRVAGHTILDGINLHIAPNSHVAIVGASGAGKSSLVGLLLGWHRASAGSVTVDGQRLEDLGVENLMVHTAWVDPAVHVWNRAFLDNLSYGAPESAVTQVGGAIDAADLVRVLQTMPDGLQTPLGEGGSRVSGGEGQRVRFGRALLRPDVRLAILDEPFRGLEHDQRRVLLSRAREVWRNATVLCITHDLEETRGFDRIVVVDGGRLVESGTPQELAGRPGSHYRRMLDEERAVRAEIWSLGGARDRRDWRHLRLANGVVVEPLERTAS